MGIVKNFFGVVMALVALTASVSAEQPAAEKYRQIFKSGNFYVEYGVGYVRDDDRRKGIDLTDTGGGFLSFSVRKPDTTEEKYRKGKVYIALACAKNDDKRATGIYGSGSAVTGLPIMQKVDKKKNYPDMLYISGKLYRAWMKQEVKKGFLGMGGDIKYSLVAKTWTLDKIKNDNWRVNLALPDELAIFYWNDPFRKQESQKNEPHFATSSKRTVNKTSYDCDEYVAETKNAAGGIFSKDIYRALYENGNLVYVQKFYYQDGKETLMSMIDVRKIGTQAPDFMFELPKGTVVTTAADSDMDNLTGNEKQVEVVGERPRNRTGKR